MDKTLVCKECGREFTFTAGEQEFYASRGLTNEPGRCPECRAARKAASGGGRSPSRGGYGDSYGSSYGGDRGGYGSDRGGYGDDRGGYGERAPRQMYTATCSSCGKEAQVPFQPTSGKPVYCSDCFSQRRSSRY